MVVRAPERSREVQQQSERPSSAQPSGYANYSTTFSGSHMPVAGMPTQRAAGKSSWASDHGNVKSNPVFSSSTGMKASMGQAVASSPPAQKPSANKHPSTAIGYSMVSESGGRSEIQSQTQSRPASAKVTVEPKGASKERENNSSASNGAKATNGTSGSGAQQRSSSDGLDRSYPYPASRPASAPSASAASQQQGSATGGYTRKPVKANATTSSSAHTSTGGSGGERQSSHSRPHRESRDDPDPDAMMSDLEAAGAACTPQERDKLQELLASAKLRDRGSTEFYSFGKVIGVGSFAKVRVARHKLTGQYVAIKTYDKAKIKDPNQLRRIQQEIKLMEKLDYELVIRLFEAIESPRRIHLVMEYLGGGNLCSYVPSSYLSRRRHHFSADYSFPLLFFPGMSSLANACQRTRRGRSSCRFASPSCICTP